VKNPLNVFCHSDPVCRQAGLLIYWNKSSLSPFLRGRLRGGYTIFFKKKENKKEAL